jgi:hypothetical protein
MKNPPKCVGGNLRIISCQYFNQSTVGAPAQYISQFYTVAYYLPGLLQYSIRPYKKNIHILFLYLPQIENAICLFF